MQKQVVEYGGVPVGIVVPQDDSLKFVAVKFHVMDLDGRQFLSLPEVKSAISALLSRHTTLAA